MFNECNVQNFSFAMIDHSLRYSCPTVFNGEVVSEPIGACKSTFKEGSFWGKGLK